MKSINFRVIEFSVALVMGILTAYFLSIPWMGLVGIPVSLGLLICVFIFNRNRFKPSLLFPCFVFLLFFQIGYWNFKLQFPYTHMADTDQKTGVFKIRITEVAKSGKKIVRYKAVSQQIDSHPIRLPLYVYQRRNIASPMFHVDDVVIAYGRLQPITTSQNPYQFDFRAYLKKQGITAQLFLDEHAIYSVTKNSNSLNAQAERMRDLLLKSLEESGLTGNELAIVQALILGKRDTLDPEIKESFTDAGAIHILAVSGLHVGIILFFLNLISGWMKRLPFGVFIQTGFLLICLWGYAYITGLSPSVVRAVSMFSFFVLGKLSNRPIHGINTLFLSFFILLLVRPEWIFQIGFQLSYLAVFFILWLHPKLMTFWRPKNLLVRYIWSLMAVSLAAQIGVAPISLFYFHQFPGLFWLTNLIVVPILPVVIGGGFIFLMWSLLGSIPELVVLVYTLLLKFLIRFVAYVGSIDSFVWHSGGFPAWILFGSYAYLLMLVLWRQTLAKKILFGGCSLILILQIGIFHSKVHPDQELLVFHKTGTSVIAVEDSDTIRVFHSKLQGGISDFPLRSYKATKRKPFIEDTTLPQLFTYHNKRFVIIDSLGVYPNVEDAIFILRDNPKIHLERLLTSNQPQLIIADGSNYRSSIRRWESSCKTHGIPFYNTKEGAFRMRP